MRHLTSILAFFLAISALQASGDKLDSLLIKANNLRLNYADFKAIDHYKQALKYDSTNLNALFHVAYLYSRQGWLNKIDEERVLLHRQAMDYAEKAYKHHPESFEANMIMAGTIARMSEFESVKARVYAAWDIKKYSDIAVALAPDDPEIWYMLAWWNFEISKASWFERSMAKMLFGGLPKNASFEDAIKGITTAIELRPNYVVYLYDLAQFYEYHDDFIKAKEALRQALQLAPTAPEEVEYLLRCRKMLSKLMD